MLSARFYEYLYYNDGNILFFLSSDKCTNCKHIRKNRLLDTLIVNVNGWQHFNLIDTLWVEEYFQLGGCFIHLTILTRQCSAQMRHGKSKNIYLFYFILSYLSLSLKGVILWRNIPICSRILFSSIAECNEA